MSMSFPLLDFTHGSRATAAEDGTWMYMGQRQDGNGGFNLVSTGLGGPELCPEVMPHTLGKPNGSWTFGWVATTLCQPEFELELMFLLFSL